MVKWLIWINKFFKGKGSESKLIKLNKINEIVSKKSTMYNLTCINIVKIKNNTKNKEVDLIPEE